MAHATSEFAATLLVLVWAEEGHMPRQLQLCAKAEQVQKRTEECIQHGYETWFRMLGLCRARKAARDAARREEKARKRS